MNYGELSQLGIKERAGRSTVVLPLGSLEQHGHHLPLLTDSLICEAIARRAQEELPDVLFLPLLWAGASEHHRGFPGTVSLPNTVYIQVLSSMLECLIQHGFRRIVLLNAHGGNDVPGLQAVYETQLRHQDLSDLWLVFANWYTMAAEQIAAIPSLVQKKVTHACELETSLILYLKPRLVKRELARGANIPLESAFYSPDFSQPSRVAVPRAFHQLSETGAFGHPENASAGKGEQILDVVVHEVVALLHEVAAWSQP
jgi:creatinine amidohydrolase